MRSAQLISTDNDENEKEKAITDNENKMNYCCINYWNELQLESKLAMYLETNDELGMKTIIQVQNT